MQVNSVNSTPIYAQMQANRAKQNQQNKNLGFGMAVYVPKEVQTSSVVNVIKELAKRDLIKCTEGFNASIVAARNPRSLMHINATDSKVIKVLQKVGADESQLSRVTTREEQAIHNKEWGLSERDNLLNRQARSEQNARNAVDEVFGQKKFNYSKFKDNLINIFK